PSAGITSGRVAVPIAAQQLRGAVDTVGLPDTVDSDVCPQRRNPTQPTAGCTARMLVGALGQVSRLDSMLIFLSAPAMPGGVSPPLPRPAREGDRGARRRDWPAASPVQDYRTPARISA